MFVEVALALTRLLQKHTFFYSCK